MLASCSGALITSLSMTPLDVVKVRLQAQSKKFNNRALYMYSNGIMDHLCAVHCIKCNNGRKENGCAMSKYRNNPRHFHGTMDAFVKIVRFEGITSLYSGLPPTLLMAIPSTVIYFTCYDKIKYLMGYERNRQEKSSIPLIAGPLGRMISATCISPLELLRTKIQSESLTYKQLVKSVKFSLKQDGISSLYRGLGATLLRDLPFSGIYWYFYELFKGVCLRNSDIDYLHIHQTLFCGATAGGIAAVCTQPFDVIKTQRQIELGEASMFKGKQAHTTWSIIDTLGKQGIQSLYSGMLPRLMKIMPACAIMISSYEYGKRYFILQSNDSYQNNNVENNNNTSVT